MQTEIAWSKIDHGLAMIYSNYRLMEEFGPEAVVLLPEVERGGVLRVALDYTGSANAAVQQGFQIEMGAGRLDVEEVLKHV